MSAPCPWTTTTTRLTRKNRGTWASPRHPKTHPTESQRPGPVDEPDRVQIALSDSRIGPITRHPRGRTLGRTGTRSGLRSTPIPSKQWSNSGGPARRRTRPQRTPFGGYPTEGPRGCSAQGHYSSVCLVAVWVMTLGTPSLRLARAPGRHSQPRDRAGPWLFGHPGRHPRRLG